MKYHYFLIIYFIFFITSVSCTKNAESANMEINLKENISEVIIDEPIDLSIKNILIYPNQFDKNSIYIDVEILSINGGDGEVQIALLNDKTLAYGNIQLCGNTEKLTLNEVQSMEEIYNRYNRKIQY